MPLQNPIILLLEDCPVTAMLVERVILQRLPACRLMWARTVAEAGERWQALLMHAAHEIDEQHARTATA